MTNCVRKSLVAGVIAGVLLIANLPLVVAWLRATGVIGWVHCVQARYLTGTAISVIVVMLFVLPNHHRREPCLRATRCGVCEHRLPSRAKYCPECGSRVEVH